MERNKAKMSEMPKEERDLQGVLPCRQKMQLMSKKERIIKIF